MQVILKMKWLSFIFIQDSTANEIRSCARYFTILNPDKVDSDGLVNGLKIYWKKSWVFLTF